MPNMDGTGPRGMGPRTGRGMGMCAPCNGCVCPMAGRCFMKKADEKEMLKDMAENLKENLKAIEERIEEL